MVKYGKNLILFFVFAVVSSFTMASQLSACDVTQVQLFIGKDRDAVENKHNTATVYTPKGSASFWYHVHITANPPHTENFELKIYDGTTLLDTKTVAADNDTVTEYSNTASALDTTGNHSIKATVKRIGTEVTGESERTLTIVEVNLSQTSPSGNITRGNSATFTASFDSSTPPGTIKYDWKFVGSDATIKDTDSSSASWSGTMVTSGTVSVQAKVDGEDFGPEKSVTATIIARTGDSWKLNNSALSEISTPSGQWPVSGNDYNLGHGESNYSYDDEIQGDTGHVTSGPNKGYWYILANNISIITKFETFYWWVHYEVKSGGNTYERTHTMLGTSYATLNTWVTQIEAHETDGSGSGTWGHHKIITDKIIGNSYYDPKTAAEALVVYGSGIGAQFTSLMNVRGRVRIPLEISSGENHPHWNNGSVDYMASPTYELISDM